MTTSLTTARRLQPEARRAQLLAAALELFAAHPEEEVGLEQLAAAAGVTRNLLYRYFSSRGDLHRAAVEEAMRRVAERVDVDESRPLESKLPRNVAMWLDAIEDGDPAVKLILRAGHSQDPAVVGVASAGREALARAIALNHLGTRRPSRAALAALDGYLAMAERLIERWDEGSLRRRDVERVLADALPAIVAAVAPRR